MKTDNTHVLMSDILKEQLPDIDEEVVNGLETQHVTVIVGLTLGSEETALVGLLRSILVSDDDNELEVRTEMHNALQVIAYENKSVRSIELHYSDKEISMSDALSIAAVRIDDVDISGGMCTLGLHLKKMNKSAT